MQDSNSTSLSLNKEVRWAIGENPSRWFPRTVNYAASALNITYKYISVEGDPSQEPATLGGKTFINALYALKIMCKTKPSLFAAS